MDLVYGVCLKYLKDSEASKDAVMNIFGELVIKLKSHEVDHFRSWLYVLARNHCLMQLRSAKNLKTVEIQPDFMQSQEPVHLNGMLDREEEFAKLEHCLKSLSKEQKLSIELFYLQNKCYKEIVELTGFEWNHVRSHIQNGRRNLKLCMEQRGSMGD
jgi:RNA polymerase sigma factor (sigma-70 family)